MQNYVNSLITLQTTEICHKINHSNLTFPSFILRSFSSESSCAVIHEIAVYVPDQVQRIFWNDDSGKFRAEMRINNNLTIFYSGPHRVEKYAAFIREYTFAQWGSWDPIQVDSPSRILAFVVYSNIEDLSQFVSNFSEYYDKVLFGQMAASNFRRRYPTIHLSDFDLPAMAISDSGHRFMLIKRIHPDHQRFRSLFKAVNKRRFGSAMKYVLKPKSQPISTEIDWNRFAYCLGIAIITIVGTVSVIFDKVRKCVRPGGGREVTLLSA
jgi:hypothetical protein